MPGIPASATSDFDWARRLLVERFKAQIRAYLTEKLVIDRVYDKARHGDTLYEAMLGGLDRNQYLSVVTHWSIGQGIAVRLRIWVEEGIKELVLHQKKIFGREIERVYTHGDLRRGLLAEADRVALAGEDETEHTHQRKWVVPVRSSIVRAATRFADETAIEYESRNQTWMTPEERVAEEVRLKLRCDALKQSALSPREDSTIRTKLICNLLVLEKPPGKIRAFRFASPGLCSLRALRDEKRNLFLLYGWLRQEKPFRVYDSVDVQWTYLMDRRITASQEFYFAGQTLPSVDFWNYLGVPYQVLLEALQDAGKILKKGIAQAIRKADPRSIRKRPSFCSKV